MRIGTTIDGTWTLTRDEDSHPVGWCKYNPPLASTNHKPTWPTLSDTDKCGRYKERDFNVYERWYREACIKINLLRKKLDKARQLHKAVGELAPFIGKKTSTPRLRIIALIKQKLEDPTS